MTIDFTSGSIMAIDVKNSVELIVCIMMVMVDVWVCGLTASKASPTDTDVSSVAGVPPN